MKNYSGRGGVGNDKKEGSQRRQWDYPVLETGEGLAISDEDKAEAMAKAFVRIHSLG